MHIPARSHEMGAHGPRPDRSYRRRHDRHPPSSPPPGPRPPHSGAGRGPRERPRRAWPRREDRTRAETHQGRADRRFAWFAPVTQPARLRSRTASAPSATARRRVPTTKGLPYSCATVNRCNLHATCGAMRQFTECPGPLRSPSRLDAPGNASGGRVGRHRHRLHWQQHTRPEPCPASAPTWRVEIRPRTRPRGAAPGPVAQPAAREARPPAGARPPGRSPSGDHHGKFVRRPGERTPAVNSRRRSPHEKSSS